METEARSDFELKSQDFQRSKTSLRMNYEAQVQVIKNQTGDLEDIRKALGLSARKMCQLLLVDPSTWTRWTRAGSDAPPHIWRSLQWFMALQGKVPGLTSGYFLNRPEVRVIEKTEPANPAEILGLREELQREVRKIRRLALGGWILAGVLFLWILISGSFAHAKLQGRLPPSQETVSDSSYFLFSSEHPPSEAVVASVVRACGPTSVIGVDSTNTHPSWLKTAEIIKNSGSRLHVYFGGPGGPTGGNVGKDEKFYMQQAAARIGMKATDPEWKKSGWEKVLQMDLEKCRQLGCYSVEVDNLDQVLGLRNGSFSGNDYVEFLKKFAKWSGEKGPKLVMKNIGQENLKAVQAAVNRGAIPRSMLADFAIFETESTSPEGEKVQKISQNLGITTLLSTNTFDYGVGGPSKGSSACSEPAKIPSAKPGRN